MSSEYVYQPRTPEQQALLVKVAQAALADPKALDMHEWHRCETTHCIAGWGIVLSNDPRHPVVYSDTGKWAYWSSERGGYNEDDAGKELLGQEATAHFREDDLTAREWLVSILRDAGEPIPQWIQAETCFRRGQRTGSKGRGRR